jgi:steroid delta-isomerase-like uncharacterized protein
MGSNVEVHAAKFEAFDRGDLDAAVKVFAESATFIDHARGLVLQGRDQIKEWMVEWRRTFPDARCTDIDYLETGNATIARLTGRATNDGPLGDLPPTGRKVVLPVCDIHECDSEGRVVRGDIYYDRLSVLEQLGHMPAPQPAAAG